MADFDHHLAPLSQATLVSSPSVSNSANCARSLASAIERTQAVAERERNIILAHDVADLVELLIKKALAMASEAPARHDRAAARDDAGDTLRGQRYISQAHAGMNGEIIDALFGLLDQRVPEHLPVELQRVAADLLQRPDRLAPCRSGPARCAGSRIRMLWMLRPVERSITVSAAPADRPRHLLDFLGDA